jgi:hypothetical protein
MEKSRAYELKLLKKHRMIQDRIARYKEEERKVSLQLAAVRKERMRAGMMQEVQAARKEEKKEERKEMRTEEKEEERQKDVDHDIAASGIRVGPGVRVEQRRAKRAQPQPPQAREGVQDLGRKLGEQEAMKVERGGQSKRSRAAALRPGGENNGPEVACALQGQPDRAREGARRSKDGVANGTPRLSLVQMLRAQALEARRRPESSAEQQ